jgi:hypothetical protein
MKKTEPVFVNLLRSPGIDSQPGGPVGQPYLLYWPAKLHGLTESIYRNRFPGSLNVYKYGLWKHLETGRQKFEYCSHKLCGAQSGQVFKMPGAWRGSDQLREF